MEVAAGKRTDTKVTVTFEPEELSWTAGELGLSSIDDDNIFVPVDAKAGELMGNAWYRLKLNLPYEMFWADNTWRWVAWEEHTNSSAQVISLDCWLVVESAYQGDDDITVDPDKIAQGRAAAENARSIVQANAGKSDYEKLVAYKDAICSLTAYNDDVYDEWVEDSNMDGEGHMWNVVRTGNGNFYLADVTNSDTGMTGEHGGLFLTGASGAGQTYVVSYDGWTCTYTYRED